MPEKKTWKNSSEKWSNSILRYEFISALHFEVISGQFAVNAAASLPYDVKKTFKKKDVLTALAFDIKRAFDRVPKTCLIQGL